MRLIVLAAMMLTIASASGCVTNSGEFCDIAQAIRPSVHDVLTDRTKRQILAHDEKLREFCGVAP